MRLLIGGSPSKLFHLNEFADTLGRNGVECKVVLDTQIYDGFPSRKIRNWFQTRSKFKNLVKEFKPDAILVDRQRHFGIAAVEEKIPLFVHLRGDFWKEIEMAKQTLYKSPPKRFVLNKWVTMAEKCFQNSEIILPICKHLENIVREKYPQKNIATMYQGITPSHWYDVDGAKLKHPCVGLLQSAVIWEKTRELLTLEPVIKKMPHVTFYWVGDGPYREHVLSRLKNYENFKWLGHMQYPDKVREYLSEIDVYLLLSGIDMAPLTLLEAQLMKRPIIATNVGGIPELMSDNKTGYLINRGDDLTLSNRIDVLLSDENKRRIMGNAGREFVTNHFNWQKISRDFVSSLKTYSLI
ncbi:MAG TPA: glycosyltransferase [Candidatus Nitrosotenuis sp.]|nr:glycosyltransferase [Candidatus Nitrosotenuis sp.]